MTAITAYIRKHPVPTYYALTFAISWSGALLVIGGPGGIPGTGEEIMRLMPLVMVAWFAGPSLAGILLTGLLDGRAGLRELGSRLVRWRVGARWYAVALLTAPFLMATILLAFSLSSPDFRPRLVTADDTVSLLAFGMISALMTAFFEELGVTGFAVHRLRLSHSVLGTGLIVGLLWGVWRSLVVVWAGSGAVGTLAPILFYSAGLFSWLPAFRLLMVLVYDRTGSLLVALLMHTSLVASWTILTPVTITGMRLVTYYWVLTAALCVVVAAVALANRGQLAPQPPRTRMA
jgi:uncharacterized protein